jgi:hypothetical protein
MLGGLSGEVSGQSNPWTRLPAAGCIIIRPQDMKRIHDIEKQRGNLTLVVSDT